MSKWISTPTQKGLALQSKLLSTDKLEITRVVSGTGKVSTGQLSAQTAVSDIKQELTVESLTYGEDGKGLLRVRIDNFSLQTGYSMNQIGIYANDPDEGEILYIIAQVTDVAEPIPSITEQPTGFTCNWSFHLVFSDSSNISVTISPDAFITSKTADLRYAKKENLVGKSLEGEAVSPSVGTTVTAAVGAEIFNDYRNRSYYDDDGVVANGNVATGKFSHAEGEGTTASGECSHAEGDNTKATNYMAHAEGRNTTASGQYSHAEGRWTVASGCDSHAECNSTEASGECSHAEGLSTKASGKYSHSEGYGTVASGEVQHVQGKYNVEDTNNAYAHIVGNGDRSKPSNAHTLDWNGNAWFAGDVYVGGTDQPNGDKLVKQSELPKGTTIDTTLTKSGQAADAKATGDAINNVVNNLELTGKNLEGTSVAVDFDESTQKISYATASRGAEIFNDYQDRAYTSSGDVSTGNIAVGLYSHAEGRGTTAMGDNSHAEGYLTEAYGRFCHAEGCSTDADGDGSHAEGYSTVASGVYSHAEGYQTTASGSDSHSEGYNTVASGNYSHAEGYGTTANSYSSHTEGEYTTTLGDYAHAEGQSENKASKNYTSSTDNDTIINDWLSSQFSLAKALASHVEGANCLALGIRSHAEGNCTVASGHDSHAEGNSTEASGECSHAEGVGTNASGPYSHAAGIYTSASGSCSFATGMGNNAGAFQTVFGKYADTSSSTDKGGLSSESATTGSLFVIGNGTGDSSRANAFRVSASGKCYGSQSFGSSGADSGEFKEWLDGNPNAEDRMGLFVTLDGDFITLATSEDDYILGVVSHPDVMSFVGNTASEEWCNKWQKDIFGRFLTKQETIPEHTDENGIFHEETQVTVRILNPDWDSTQTYIPREERPEWDAICFEGQVIVVDDSSCKVNGYCSVSSNGKATASDSGYRVMKRIDDTHIKILFR